MFKQIHKFIEQIELNKIIGNYWIEITTISDIEIEFTNWIDVDSFIINVITWADKARVWEGIAFGVFECLWSENKGVAWLKGWKTRGK